MSKEQVEEKGRWLVPVIDTHFGPLLRHGLPSPVLFMGLPSYAGWRPFGSVSLAHQTYVKKAAEWIMEESGRPREVAVLAVETGKWVTVWARNGHDALHPPPALQDDPVEGERELLSDPKAAYYNFRTCICGEDADEHVAGHPCEGFDPDWGFVRGWLNAVHRRLREQDGGEGENEDRCTCDPGVAPGPGDAYGEPPQTDFACPIHGREGLRGPGDSHVFDNVTTSLYRVFKAGQARDRGVFYQERDRWLAYLDEINLQLAPENVGDDAPRATVLFRTQEEANAEVDAARARGWKTAEKHPLYRRPQQSTEDGDE